MESHSSPKGKIRVLDLFSGAGGLSEGFRLASKRYVTLRAIELDQAAAASYEANHGKGIVFAGSIQNWLKDEEVPGADLIIGGPPCQGFSALGKRNIDDDRNALWEFYAQTISRAQPRVFVLENVPAFLKSPQLRRFGEMFQSNGSLRDYTFQAKILNAAEFGAAQTRKRVIMIGNHHDLDGVGFPEIPSIYVDRNNWMSLKDVLSGISEQVENIDLPEREYQFGSRAFSGSYRTDELHVTRRYEEVSLRRFECIGPGGNRFQIPDELLSRCWRNHKTGSGDVMGRLRWDKPSVTIRTEFFKPEKGRYLHPTENRAITHLEAARIQGFRDDYLWVGSKTAIARQIGNAVPVPLAKAIGSHLAKHL